MITEHAIEQARKIRGWIIVYLKDRIRNVDHFEAPWNKIQLCGTNITMECPCDGVAVTTSLDNIKAYTILDNKFAPHQGLTTSELLDRLTCSEYLQCKTQFRCKDSLVGALEEMYGKGNVEVHETSQQLMGYKGDLRKDAAEIIVRRKHVGGASNDLGFKLQSDGTYLCIRSAYEVSNGHFNDAKLHKLEGHYAIKSIQAVALQQRRRIETKAVANNKIKLRVYV